MVGTNAGFEISAMHRYHRRFRETHVQGIGGRADVRRQRTWHKARRRSSMEAGRTYRGRRANTGQLDAVVRLTIEDSEEHVHPLLGERLSERTASAPTNLAAHIVPPSAHCPPRIPDTTSRSRVRSKLNISVEGVECTARRSKV